MNIRFSFCLDWVVLMQFTNMRIHALKMDALQYMERLCEWREFENTKRFPKITPGVEHILMRGSASKEKVICSFTLRDVISKETIRLSVIHFELLLSSSRNYI